MIGSAVGAPVAQSQGSDVQRSQQDAAGQARETQMNQKAEQASGVGQTEQHEQASDRDADGRRPWELGPRPAAEEASAAVEPPIAAASSRPKDPTGWAGRHLDLQG
jgi:hypothetical protein